MGKSLAIKIIPLFALMLGVAIIFLVVYSISAQRKDIVQTPVIDAPSTTSIASTSTPIVTPTTTTLIFGGDVMLSRVVGQKMEKYNDFAWPFRKVADILKNTDLAVVNLESPFTYNSNHRVETGSFSFDADPRSVEGMQLAGIDLVSLANNHFGNQGQQGMRDTFDILKNASIAQVGGGLDRASAHESQIIERNGIRFGFLGYGYPEDLYVATDTLAGIASMDVAQAQIDIKNLRDHVDVVIVLIHAGTEYVAEPNWQQEEFARVAVDAGADVVIGHHPHWVQQTELYKGKPILYSLGNLVFDQMWSTETQQGALTKLIFEDKNLQQIEIIPVRIRDYGQPELITDEKEKQQVLNRMGLTESIISIQN